MDAENQKWIARERRDGETVEQTLDRMAQDLTDWYRLNGHPEITAFEWRMSREWDDA